MASRCRNFSVASPLRGRASPSLSFEETEAGSRAQALERSLRWAIKALGQQRGRGVSIYATIIVKRLAFKHSRATPPHRQNQHERCTGGSDSQSETGNYRDQNRICQAPERSLLIHARVR